MGLYDRDYTQEGFQSQFGHAPQMRMSWPKITPVVKWLLIVNFAVFFVGALFLQETSPVPVSGLEIEVNILEKWFSVFPHTSWAILQVWRLVTYQFLHATIGHILFNMLGLYFLGPTLERHWQSKKFLIFYLSCGVAGGLFYTLLTMLNFLMPAPMVGASGAILGMLAACAILFPHFVVFIFFFPVPIRVAAIGLTIMYFFYVVTQGPNAGGHAAHLAGMAAGAGYVFSRSWRDQFTTKIRAARWKKNVTSQRDLQVELDRILEKVHKSGLQSLTAKEKKILKEATRAEQMRGGF
jgi:membrane associated rhomboid family serine protease